MWYRTGTITLKTGTNKVLGMGTKWQDKLANVEAGQPLIVNGNIYEITEVRSDTELYIKESALEDVTNNAYVIMSVVYGSLGDVALKASKALAHYQEQMDVFDMMYSGTQAFKVTKPDGTEIEMYPYSMLSVEFANLNNTLQTVATHATNAKASETNAKNSAASATSSATSASSSATTATASANDASLSATNAKTSETNAAKSATAAASSATSASTSASNAKTSETKAKEYVDSVNVSSLLTKEDNLKSVENLAEAQANLRVFKQLPNLTEKDDLNTLWGKNDVGVRSCTSDITASTSRGYPIQRAGSLITTHRDEGGYVQIYFAWTGEMFHRFATLGGAQVANWTQVATLNLPNTFKRKIEVEEGRGLSVRATDKNATLVSSEGGNSLLWQIRKGNDDQDILDTFVGMRPSGIPFVRIRSADSDILHTGNACVTNGIGSVYVFMRTTYNIPNSLHTGSNLESDLSGTWKALRMSFASIAGVAYYIQPFVRVA